ncbi:MAG TPA: DUF4870 domain-containing protein [Ktedonobacterales bacterium]|nr:DUF4870 domain-containing protein [Ktedonobacterales bacterium]
MSSTGASGAATLIGIPLRGGGALSVWSDRLEVAGASYPLADIAWVGLVNDPASPPGAQPLPAVAWRLANGQYVSATPADPPHAWQILEALFAQRPDLRTPLPPPAPSAAQPGGWGPPPPQYGYPPAYGGPGYPPPQSNDNQTVMAGLAHLSIFFGALIVPLILWLVNRGKAPYAAQQSKQAFFFHLALFVVEMVIGFVAFFVFFASAVAIAPSTGYPEAPLAAFFGGIILFYVLYFAFYIFAVVFGIIGAVKAFKGESFHYPLMGRV